MIVTVNLVSWRAGDVTQKSHRRSALIHSENFGAMNVLCTDKTGTLTYTIALSSTTSTISMGTPGLASSQKTPHPEQCPSIGSEEFAHVAVLKHVELEVEGQDQIPKDR